jgi:CheY-like chemotaxis protein
VVNDKAGIQPTVLLADDDALVRQVLAKMLESLGCTVIEAADGNRALEQFKQHANTLSLILVDMLMPFRNGNLVARAVRTYGSDVPLVIMSASRPAAEATAHADAVLAKPFDLKELYELLAVFGLVESVDSFDNFELTREAVADCVPPAVMQAVCEAALQALGPVARPLIRAELRRRGHTVNTLPWRYLDAVTAHLAAREQRDDPGQHVPRLDSDLPEVELRGLRIWPLHHHPELVGARRRHVGLRGVGPYIGVADSRPTVAVVEEPSGAGSSGGQGAPRPLPCSRPAEA